MTGLPYVGLTALPVVWTSALPFWNGVVPVATAVADQATPAPGTHAQCGRRRHQRGHRTGPSNGPITNVRPLSDTSVRVFVRTPRSVGSARSGVIRASACYA